MSMMNPDGFVAYLQSNFAIMLLLFLPILALVIKLLYIRHSNIYYVDHFIFTLHNKTAFFCIYACFSVLTNQWLRLLLSS